MDLQALGLNAALRERLDAEKQARWQLARVITVDRDSCRITTGQVEARAELTGRMLQAAASALDYPAVGDWVYAQLFDDDAFAVIHAIVPRISVLKRKTAGRRIDYQPIAANIDTAFVVQALDAGVNLQRLERYLVMVREARIQPEILLNKCDLVAPETLAAQLDAVRRRIPGVAVQAISATEGAGLHTLAQRLTPGCTYCLLGVSGVGKTTLLNRLLGDGELATGHVRAKDHKGRHTTSRRELLQLPTGALIVDTPGMRELGMIAVEEGLGAVFDDVVALAAQCRYHDCSHTQEAGCAVLEALDAGRIDPQHYRNFIKLTREAAFHDLSHQEKRRRDRAFGRMVKAAMRDNLKT